MYSNKYAMGDSYYESFIIRAIDLLQNKDVNTENTVYP